MLDPNCDGWRPKTATRVRSVHFKISMFFVVSPRLGLGGSLWLLGVLRCAMVVGCGFCVLLAWRHASGVWFVRRSFGC